MIFRFLSFSYFCSYNSFPVDNNLLLLRNSKGWENTEANHQLGFYWISQSLETGCAVKGLGFKGYQWQPSFRRDPPSSFSF